MNVVTSYTNPDLDGVGSALGYSAWAAATSGAVFVPVVVGRLDGETQLVLKAVGAVAPRAVTSFADVDQVVLVDTHHVRQLPPDLPKDRVVDIIDHHAGGDAWAFPIATITNELTGAAATVVAERLRTVSAGRPGPVMRCLAAAIWSNTLGFGAASVSPRDRLCFDWLAATWPLPAGLLEAMSIERRALLDLTTPELVARDVKVFGALGGLLAISQVEAPGAGDIANRADLQEGLSELRRLTGADFAMLNLVDTGRRRTTFISTDANLLDFLTSLGITRVAPDRSMSDTMILRKGLHASIVGTAS